MVYYTYMDKTTETRKANTMYRLIINTGNVHNAKEIAHSTEELQKAVKFHQAHNHTIVEVQTRDSNGTWQNT